ncbi:hypothetical protein BC629DRAFT_1736198 [Irpex lacteus]|nr:hypothetical protein BC629DRAFT_1736198 [Irpex lacteus]
MVYSRLRHLLVMFWPSLCFTLPDSVSSVSVFSVACLVLALVSVTVLFPLCFLASVYHALVFHHPRMFLFGDLGSLLYVLDAFPSFVANVWFMVLYAVLLIVIWFRFVGYVKNVTLRQRLQEKIYKSNALAKHVLKKERIRKQEAGEAETRLITAVRELDDNRIELGRAEKTLKETRERAARRKRISLFHNRRLGTHVAICERVVQKAQENAYKQKCKQLKATRKSGFKELAAAQQCEERRVFLLMKKNERLEDHIESTNREREAVTAAHHADLAHFEQQRAAHDAQHAALQQSLSSACIEHHDHMEECERRRTLVQERLEQQSAAMDRAQSRYSQQLDVNEKLNRVHIAALEAKHNLLTECLEAAQAARDAVTASFKVHIEESKTLIATHEAQYIALEGSVAFSTTEHRIHMEYCEDQAMSEEALIEQLTAQIAAERGARVEVEAKTDELKNRHALVSEGYADVEAKIKVEERKLYLQEQRQHSTTMAYRAGQHVADTLVNSLIVGRTRRSQAKTQEPYPEQLTDTLPPPSLFDETLLPDFVEGSSRDASSTVGSTAATSTAYTAEGSQQPSKLDSTLLQSASIQSLCPSPPPSGSTATLDLEPSLPPLPSQSFEDVTTDSPEDDSALSNTLQVSVPDTHSKQLLAQPSISLPSLDFEPSLPPPPDSDLSTSQLAFDPYLSPASSVPDSSIAHQLPDPERTPTAVPVLEPSLLSPSPPVSGTLNVPNDRLNLSLGNESFGASIVAKSTPILTRRVNTQTQAVALESLSREISMSRSGIMTRVSDLSTQASGFETGSSSHVIDVEET